MTGEKPLPDEPVLPEAGQAVRGQPHVCLARGGWPRGRADRCHATRHTRQRLSRAQRADQVGLNHPVKGQCHE